MFISYDSGKCPIMWKLYLAYLVNFAEEAGLVEFAGDLSGQKTPKSPMDCYSE